MLNWNLLQSILIISIACSSVTVIFIQKTKRFCRSSKQVPVYSLIVNMVLGFLFSQTFSDISYVNSIWAGLFSFLGADTLYKSLEGNLASYSELTEENNINLNNTQLPVNDETINSEDEIVDSSGNAVNNNDIVGEITYE